MSWLPDRHSAPCGSWAAGYGLNSSTRAASSSSGTRTATFAASRSRQPTASSFGLRESRRGRTSCSSTTGFVTRSTCATTGATLRTGTCSTAPGCPPYLFAADRRTDSAQAAFEKLFSRLLQARRRPAAVLERQAHEQGIDDRELRHPRGERSLEVVDLARRGIEAQIAEVRNG